MNEDVQLGIVARGEWAAFDVFIFESSRLKQSLAAGDDITFSFLIKGTTSPLYSKKRSLGTVTFSAGVATATLIESETEQLQAGLYVLEVIFFDSTLSRVDKIFEAEFEVEESTA